MLSLQLELMGILVKKPLFSFAFYPDYYIIYRVDK